VTFDLKNSQVDTLHLDFAGDRIYYIIVNDCDISNGYIFEHHKLPLPVKKLKPTGNIVKIAYTNKYCRNGNGLHSYVDPKDNEQYLYSQFECPYCHMFMPCFDQPSLKAVLTLIVLAPAKWTVIANQRERVKKAYTPQDALPSLLSSKFKDSPANIWRFQATPKISTYLYAMCAGNYFSRCPDTSMSLTTPMRLFCRRAYSDLLTEEFARQWFEVSDHGLRFHGDLMGEKYPYPKLDQVIVPEYNWGAMENVGCIVYNECYLPKITLTRSRVIRTHSVILHELAHQWYGNLVTMHWWEDLWLNEAFATFVGTLAQLQFKDDGEDANIAFLGETIWGIFTDQRNTTHPIALDVKDTECTETIFDGISYGKGGSWLKQLYKYVGSNVFRDGVQRYMSKFRGGNTRLNDFVDCMEIAVKAAAQANGIEPVDISGWAKKWLTEKGVMLLSASVDMQEDKITSFIIEQDFDKYADRNYKEHKMDIIVYDRQMKSIRKEVTVHAEAKTDLTNEFVNLEAAAVMLNAGCHSYVKVQLNEVWVNFLIEHFSEISDNFDKNYLVEIMYDMVRDAKLNPILFIKSLVNHVLEEKQIQLLKGSVGRSITVVKNFVNPTYREQYSNMLFNALVKALRNTEEEERKLLFVNQILNLLNTDANIKKAYTWLEQGHIEDKHKLEKDQKRNILFHLCGVCGVNWITEIDKDRLVSKYIGDDCDSDALKYKRKCEVARPTKSNKQKWWNWMLNVPEGVSQTDFGFVCHAFSIGLSAETARASADEYFKYLPVLFKNKGPTYGDPFLHGCNPVEADPSPRYLGKFEQVLKANKDLEDNMDKFLEDSGVALLDLLNRFQKGWDKSDPSIWCGSGQSAL